MCVSVWFYNTQITECQQLFNLFKKAGSALEPQELVVERRMLHKLLNIMDNTTHPLHNLLVNRVFSVRDSFSSIAMRTITGGHSCPLR